VPLLEAETHPSDSNENGKDNDEDSTKLWLIMTSLHLMK